MSVSTCVYRVTYMYIHICVHDRFVHAMYISLEKKQTKRREKLLMLYQLRIHTYMGTYVCVYV